MFAIIHLLATFIADLFKSPRRLEVENLFLRHQLNVALTMVLACAKWMSAKSFKTRDW
jgi:hypothetical protein